MLSTSLETCCTRSEIAHPWCGPVESVLNISRSSVPCGSSIRSVNSVSFHFYRRVSATRVEVQGECDEGPWASRGAFALQPQRPGLNSEWLMQNEIARFD